MTKIASGRLRSAFDARPELLEGLPVEEVQFVDRLVDGFLPASDRLVGVGNEGAAVDPGATYDLEAISAPTLVVHTRDDSLNPFAIAEEIARRIRGARLLAFAQGGHLLLSHHAELRRQITRYPQLEVQTRR